MSHTDAIHTLLSADGTLTAILTGGVYHVRDVPEQINTDTFADVYDMVTNMVMLPWAAVRGRDTLPFGGLRDRAAQLSSARQVVEIYFYDDPTAGWDTIESAADRVYALLQDKAVSGTYKLNWINTVNDQRDDAMGGATLIRLDFEVKFKKLPS